MSEAATEDVSSVEPREDRNWTDSREPLRPQPRQQGSKVFRAQPAIFKLCFLAKEK